MKKINKILSIGLSLLLMLPLASLTSFASANIEETELEKTNTVYYNIFNGTVKEIVSYYDRDGKEVEDSMFIFSESEDGNVVNFLITGDTYMITDNEIAVGSKIIGIYDAQAPVIMIYPPQYPAVAIAIDFPEEQSIKADKFDKNFLSSDNMLKLNISDNTEIVYQDGTLFEDDIAMLADRKMIVVYSISTRSIPAQTPPIKIIVLHEEAAVTPEITVRDISKTDIIVNHNKINAPSLYINDKGIIMTPIRAISEALGYEVVWDGETQRVTIDGNIVIRLGQDLYSNSENDTIKLGTMPVLIDNAHTYVPLDFFTTVLNLESIIITEGQIIINNITDENASIVIGN